ncbi:NTCP5-like protein [Mya arenaria]|uniref:NTCP5-like protein n=1 Tax=Mya arenaria TaxID=6604 RepID=A0ABY7EW12_MYAAR|nr:NTCP5-like protein [Mya arenaria]WAR13184.1 NTCP5-like protein [Mya arenaria]
MACPVKTFIFFVLNCLLSLYGSVSANKTSAYGAYGVEVTSHQEFPVLVMENYEKMLSFTLRNFRGDVLEIVPVMENPEVAEMEMNSSETLQPHETKNFTAKVKAKFLGRTKLKLFVNTSQVTEHDMYEIASTGAGEPLEWYEQPETYEVTVSRDESPLSHAFTGTVIILVCLANIAMGCKTELAVVKEVLRRPTGPLTGMFSQFILMPMIPYTNILTSLVGLIIPVALGMLLQWRKPNWAKYVVRGIRPLMVIFFIFVFTVGVYSNLYIFTLMRNKPEILLAGALVPYVGFIFGGLVAIVTRQSWERVRTISIETGIQNTGIAIVLLKVSLPSPDSDLSIVAPIASAIFTPIPMLVAIIWYEIYKRCYKKKKEVYIDDHEGESDVESGVEGEYHRHDNCYVELKENNNLHNVYKF